MRTPFFWYTNNPLSSVFAPLAKIYERVGRRHRTGARAHAVSIPVICVGNIVSGGSGKTPTAIALLNLLRDSKIALSPFFLTRGYRGRIEGPERVDDSHDPKLWGDEALVLSRHASTIVSRQRYAGGLLARDLGADFVIMDDGMQNYQIEKNLTFCVIDGSMGFGNGKIVPQGPLRQTLEDGFELTDAFILIGEDKKNTASQLPAIKPVFRAEMLVKPGQTLSPATNYIAFCGIGFPEKFRNSLKQASLNVIEFKFFGDHHAYTPNELSKLLTRAVSKNARLITTEKDFARLPDFFQKDLIDILAVEIVFEDTGSLVDFIKTKIAA